MSDFGKMSDVVIGCQIWISEIFRGHLVNFRYYNG